MSATSTRRSPAAPCPWPPVAPAALIGSAITDYLLRNGTRTAPAGRAATHIAGWLDRHGYTITRKQA